MKTLLSNYMDTSNLIFTIGESIFFTIEDCSLSAVVSAEYVSTGQLTMDQNWINDDPAVDQRWMNDPSTIIYNVSSTQELHYLQY